MSVSFASPQWGQSIAHLDWGNVFKPLVEDVLWVLTTTVASDEQRTDLATQLAAAMRWFSDSYALLCVQGTHTTAAQVPRFVAFGESSEMLLIAARSFTEQEQREFAGEVGHQPWPAIQLTQQKVLEMLETAVFHAYTRLNLSSELLCLDTPVGAMYIFPKERKRQVERSLVLH